MNGAWCIRSRLSYSMSHCFPIQSFPFNSARPRTLYYIISNLTRFFLATYIPPTCPAPIDTNASLVIKFTSKFYCRSYHPPLFISRSPPFNSTPLHSSSLTTHSSPIRHQITHQYLRNTPCISCTDTLFLSGTWPPMMQQHVTTTHQCVPHTSPTHSPTRLPRVYA